MSFDATQFTVFGIPPYAFFAGIGAFFAFLVFNCLLLYFKADIRAGNRAVVLSIPILLLGAKFFGIVASLFRSIVQNKPINYKTFLNSSIVFYGGLIFFVISFLFMIHKLCSEEKKKILNALVVAIPLFHCFGRIGCFTGGCCYGIQTDLNIGIIYTTWVNGHNSTATRIPIQLIEAALNFILFAILLWLVLHKKEKINLLKVYIVSYSGIRFLDEFFRDGFDKSILNGISAAQIISILLIAVIIIITIKERKFRNVQQG